MNKKLIPLTLFSLSLFSCNNANPNLWNRTFKSTGKTIVDYQVKLENNKTKKAFLQENYPSNIDWENSGVYNDYEGKIREKFPGEIHNDFAYFIDSLNGWWMSDVVDPSTRTYHYYKKVFDHTTTIVKLISDGFGQVTFKSDINPDKPSSVDYEAYDKSEESNGSLLMIKREGTEDFVGYVRYTGFNNIVNIRSGFDPDSAIEFKITLKQTVDNIDSFSLYNYIEIKEYRYTLPWWAIVLIVLGSLGLIYIVYLIIKHYRRYHHKY